MHDSRSFFSRRMLSPRALHTLPSMLLLPWACIACSSSTDSVATPHGTEEQHDGGVEITPAMEETTESTVAETTVAETTAAETTASPMSTSQAGGAAEPTVPSPPLVEEELPLLEPNGEESQNQCERQVSFDAVALETPPPFDVVIVADHSESISWSREDLARGLSTLAANVYGHAVRFFVLTPTQYGESSAGAIDLKTGEALVNWQDPTTGAAYEHPVTRYVRSCKDLDGRELVCPDYPPPNIEFELEGNWEFVMPEPVAVLTSDMTPTQLEAERSKVAGAILALGTTGSLEEQPLCTLTRYLEQAPALLPERAVFVVISDEDDTASVEDCAEGNYYERRFPTGGPAIVAGCTDDCDQYVFRVSRTVARNTLNFDCVPVDDSGGATPELSVPASTGGSSTDTCADGPSAPCTEAELERAALQCDTGWEPRNCQRNCVEGAAESICSHSTTERDLDLCTETLESGGYSYANLVDYCNQRWAEGDWRDCTVTGYSTEELPPESFNVQERSHRSTLVQAGSLADMVHLFHSNAERTFGADNYFVESIVFDGTDSCEPDVGQSVATELLQLSRSPDHVFPICESYSPALQQVGSFAQELLRTEYSVELGPRESIESVEVEGRDASVRQLTEDDYSYDAETGRLHIDAEAISSADLRLSVQVVDPCVPRVR